MAEKTDNSEGEEVFKTEEESGERQDVPKVNGSKVKPSMQSKKPDCTGEMEQAETEKTRDTNNTSEMEKTDTSELETSNTVEAETGDANNKSKAETEDTSTDSQTLSHAEFKMCFQEALGQIIQGDPFLADLHPQITPEEVDALIELEHGRAMRVYVEREGDSEGGSGEKAWEVVVPRDATLYQLKHNLRHHVALVLSRQGIKKRISWKYVWKNNWLSFNGERLMDDNAKLLQYGIRNKSSLKFVRRYREKHKSGKWKK